MSGSCNCCCHQRLPYQPLGDSIDRRAPGISQNGIARLLGVHPQMVSRWRQRGWMSLEQAENACDALDVHPSAIWSEYLELAAA